MRAPRALAAIVALSLTIACGAPAGTPAPATAETFVDVGFLDFPTSGSEAAQSHFLRGVAILHSFGYKQAIAEFQQAQKIEPDFALAYWGESLCYNHPMLPERDVESPRAVLARLGASVDERATKAPTERERGFLQAVEALFGEGSTPERRIAYMRAMERLYSSLPEDPEVASFYALSLLSAVGPMHDDSFRMSVLAGSIALDVFAKNPNHPGAAHYIIHAFDDPVHAPLALPAAERFAEIAGAVSHARHMPSHIFIQRGMWDRVSRSNDNAYQVALDLWEPGDNVSDMVHSIDWGHYGDLQRGDLERARARTADLESVVTKSEGAERAKGTIRLLRARFAVETEAWEPWPVTADSSDDELLVSGIAAARAGDMALARQSEARLAEQAARNVEVRSTFSEGSKPAQVMHREVAAAIALAESQEGKALSLLEEGVAIAESMGPPRGSATPVKPVHEYYGEVLLGLGHSQRAAELFERSLLRTPNRPLSLRGLARALAAAGDREGARLNYRKLIAAREGRDALAEVGEARRYLEPGAASTGG